MDAPVLSMECLDRNDYDGGDWAMSTRALQAVGAWLTLGARSKQEVATLMMMAVSDEQMATSHWAVATKDTSNVIHDTLIGGLMSGPFVAAAGAASVSQHCECKSIVD